MKIRAGLMGWPVSFGIMEDMLKYHVNELDLATFIY